MQRRVQELESWMACLADSIMLASGGENQAPRLKNDIQKVSDGLSTPPYSVFTDSTCC